MLMRPGGGAGGQTIGPAFGYANGFAATLTNAQYVGTTTHDLAPKLVGSEFARVNAEAMSRCYGGGK